MTLQERVKAFSEKVAPIYKLLNWQWGRWPDGQDRIPEARHIEDSILERIADANKLNTTSYSGGLFAYPEGWNNEPGQTFGLMIEDHPR